MSGLITDRKNNTIPFAVNDNYYMLPMESKVLLKACAFGGKGGLGNLANGYGGGGGGAAQSVIQEIQIIPGTVMMVRWWDSVGIYINWINYSAAGVPKLQTIFLAKGFDGGNATTIKSGDGGYSGGGLNGGLGINISVAPSYQAFPFGVLDSDGLLYDTGGWPGIANNAGLLTLSRAQYIYLSYVGGAGVDYRTIAQTKPTNNAFTFQFGLSGAGGMGGISRFGFGLGNGGNGSAFNNSAYDLDSIGDAFFSVEW